MTRLIHNNTHFPYPSWVDLVVHSKSAKNASLSCPSCIFTIEIATAFLRLLLSSALSLSCKYFCAYSTASLRSVNDDCAPSHTYIAAEDRSADELSKRNASDEEREELEKGGSTAEKVGVPEESEIRNSFSLLGAESSAVFVVVGWSPSRCIVVFSPNSAKKIPVPCPPSSEQIHC